MRINQIWNVYIVSDACSIRCLIVISKDSEMRSLTFDHLLYDRVDVVGSVIWVFINESARMWPDWVEISENYRLDIVIFWCILDDIFAVEFALSIWGWWLEVVSLFEWRWLRKVVHGGTTAKYEFGDVIFLHAFEQGDSCSHIVCMVVYGLCTTVFYRFESCKMNHTIYFLLCEDRV